MKIAIVTSTFPPYAGGIGNVAAANARELVKLGHEVAVFTPTYEAVEEEIKDLKVQRLKPVFSYGNAALIFGLTKLLSGYEIIHLHYPFFGGAEMVWLHAKKLKKTGTKIILHYHMDVVGAGFLKTFFAFHTRFILPRIIAIADKVVVTSIDYGQNSNIAGLLAKNSDKFVEVPNGVDSLNFKPAAKDKKLIKKYQIKPEEKIVLFVGGLDRPHYFKGVEYLIEAMSRLRQENYLWRLIIVGEGELKQQYSDLAAQLHLDSRTIFTGYVKNQDLPKYYNLADVVVLPSIDKSEAFGMALVEGMACARSVIASDLPGVRSVFANEVEGLRIKIKDADDLASKINYLLSNPEVACRFGSAGRRKVEQIYDWKIIGRKLEEIYNQVRR